MDEGTWSLILLREIDERFRSSTWALRMLIACVASDPEKVRFLRNPAMVY